MNDEYYWSHLQFKVLTFEAIAIFRHSNATQNKETVLEGTKSEAEVAREWHVEVQSISDSVLRQETLVQQNLTDAEKTTHVRIALSSTFTFSAVLVVAPWSVVVVVVVVVV